MSMSNKGRIAKGISSNSFEDASELRRGPWTLDEDNLLIRYISCHGEGRWNSLAKSAGLNRTGKSCRLRWLNYLKPDIKRGNLTPHEQILILELHSKWGNRWSKIAQHLPGRTDNEIKNYWRTRVQKQARQLKVDSNSKKFIEAIRMFWMPRLLEKIEQESSVTSSPSSSISTTATQDLITSPSQPPSTMVNNSDYTKSPVVSGFLTLPNAQSCDKISSLEDEYCYHVDIPSYDVQELGSHYTSMSECHVTNVDWFGEDLGSSPFWDTEELWQFRTP